MNANEIDEIKKIASKNDRYKNFKFFSTPIPLKELIQDKKIEVVQVHSTQIYGEGENKDIVGFCGQFSCKDGKITPLDGDSYNENMTVIGYSWWTNKESKIELGLDILVGNDW